MTNGKNKGNAYERKIASEYRELGFDQCKTSRHESKMLDDQKVDLTHTDPWFTQCKAQERGIYPHDILDSMPRTDNINVLFHKRNRKGEVVSMRKEDFYKVVKLVRHIQNRYPTVAKLYLK